MDYRKELKDGYIVYIICGDIGNGNITEAEYNDILSVIRSKPTHPKGYDYKLRSEDLTWELYKLPVVPPEDEEATKEDYKSALNQLGVNVE